MKYYIADPHFFHASLNVQMDHRGFASGEEMNAYMLTQWNGRVRDGDDVYILGDLSLGGAEETNALLQELSGRLFLIRGNHDRFGRNQNYSAERFEWIRDYAEIRDGGRKVVLCHYPIPFYNGQYHVRFPKTGGIEALLRREAGEDADVSPDAVESRRKRFLRDRDSLPPKTYMLYGHVHDTVDERLMRRFVEEIRQTTRTDQDGNRYHIPCHLINCFCMFSDYVPLSLNEWIENDARRSLEASAKQAQ